MPDDPKPPPPADCAVPRVILESMEWPSLAVDTRCNLLRLNARAERLTGIADAVARNRRCRDLLGANPCDDDCPAKRAIRDRRPTEARKITFRLPDGRTVTASTTAAPLADAGGEVLGALMVLRPEQPFEKIDESSDAAETSLPWSTRRAELEKQAIERALADCDGNMTEAAKRLKMHRSTLWRKIKRHGVRK